VDRVVTGGQQLSVDFLLLPLEGNVRPVGSVLGVVRDTAGHPITSSPFVVATASGYKRQSRVDSTGHYRIDSIPLGLTRVTARSVGYHMTWVDTAITIQGEQLRLDFVLRVETITLGQLPLFGPQSGGSVSGVVRDTAGRPIPSVAVSIRGMNRGTTTDSLGQYRIDSVPKGAVHLLVRRIGYAGSQVDTTLALPGQGLTLDFVLRVQIFRLAPVHD
jgi:hypothetical protein